VEFPFARRTGAQPELVEHDWVSSFEDLNVADSSVRDVRMDAIRAVPCRPRAGASSNCLNLHIQEKGN
jgi:3'-phosphoadenosine 5'-phosphosulfate sulfotransferase